MKKILAVSILAALIFCARPKYDGVAFASTVTYHNYRVPVPAAVAPNARISWAGQYQAADAYITPDPDYPGSVDVSTTSAYDAPGAVRLPDTFTNTSGVN